MAASQPIATQTLTGVDDLAGAFAKRSPKASVARLLNLSHAAEALTALSDEQLKNFAAAGTALPDLVNRVLTQARAPANTSTSFTVDRRRSVEVAQGEGLTEPLTEEEGQRRIQAYAQKPNSLESWAGPTAGPVEIERTLDIPRSTLNVWQRKRWVIGLKNGVGRTVLPTEQFIGSKPIDGLADVFAVIGDPRVTWRWLKTAHPLLGGVKPLTRLQQGRLEEVLSAAQTNFGQ